jgi:hypothetical protein
VAEITDKLREKLILVLAVDGGVPHAVRLCLEFPGVDEATAAGNEIRIVYAGTRATVADLNARLVQSGIRVTSLREEEPDLEQVFLTVTGDHAPAENG